jgi:hypothetical protein
MKTYKYGIFSVALVLCIAASFWFTPVIGEDKSTQELLEVIDKIERQTLVGLPGVGVIVTANAMYGLKPDEIQMSIAQRLKSYHINVFSTNSNQLKEVPGGPILSINVDNLEANRMGLIPVSVQVSLREYVRLERNPQKIIFTHTWVGRKSRIIGITTPAAFRETIENAINNCVEAFALAYLAANADEIKK